MQNTSEILNNQDLVGSLTVNTSRLIEFADRGEGKEVQAFFQENIAPHLPLLEAESGKAGEPFAQRSELEEKREIAALGVGLVMQTLPDKVLRQRGQALIRRISSITEDSPAKQIVQTMGVTRNELAIFVRGNSHTADFFLPTAFDDPLSNQVLHYYYRQLADQKELLFPESPHLHVERVDLSDKRFYLLYGFSDRPDFQASKTRTLAIAQDKVK